MWLQHHDRKPNTIARALAASMLFALLVMVIMIAALALAHMQGLAPLLAPHGPALAIINLKLV